MYTQVHIKIKFRFHALHSLCLTGLSHIVGSKPMWHDSTRHEEPDDFLVRKKEAREGGSYETNKNFKNASPIFIIKNILQLHFFNLP